MRTRYARRVAPLTGRRIARAAGLAVVVALVVPAVSRARGAPGAGGLHSPIGVGIGPFGSIAVAVRGGLPLAVVEAPDRPGDGTMRLPVQDGQGRPVVDATVVFVVEMDGMAMALRERPARRSASADTRRGFHSAWRGAG